MKFNFMICYIFIHILSPSPSVSPCPLAPTPCEDTGRKWPLQARKPLKPSHAFTWSPELTENKCHLWDVVRSADWYRLLCHFSISSHLCTWVQLPHGSEQWESCVYAPITGSTWPLRASPTWECLVGQSCNEVIPVRRKWVVFLYVRCSLG